MKISIIGGGWLGQPLALSLKKNHSVRVSKRTEAGCDELKQLGLEAHQYVLGDAETTLSLQSLLDCELLIINIPPGRKSFQAQEFIQSMCGLIRQGQRAGVKQILMISTTAVYGEQSRTVYEYSKVDPETDSAKAHIEIERYLSQLYGNRSAILRLAGLVGADRHPAKHLAGRVGIEDGNRVVNLVHLNDVIATIEQIIHQNAFGHTFHLCAKAHPMRKDYYPYAAQRLDLPVPLFAPCDANPTGKQINCDLTLERLNLQLSFADPRDMLN